MLKEISSTLKAMLYERVSNPLLSSIIFAWLYFNWRAVAYFFLSDSDIENKIDYINSNYSCISYNVIYPLIAGSLFSVFVPWISCIPFYIKEKSHSVQLRWKQVIEGGQALSIEQSNLMRSEIIEKRKELKSIIAKYESQIKENNDLITVLTKENQELYFDLSELKPKDPSADPEKIELTATQNTILDAHTGLSEGNVQIASDIAKAIDIEERSVQEALESLVEMGLLITHDDVTDDDGNEVVGYSLSNLGRKYLGYKKRTNSRS